MRVVACTEVCYRAPFCLVAKLGKLDEILVRGGDSGLNPTFGTKPEYLVKRRKVPDQLVKFRARTTGAEPQENISRRKLYK